MTIPSFDIHHGELLYSALGRLSNRMHFRAVKSFQELALGSPNALATIDLPASLRALEGALPQPSYSADTLLRRHTLFPLYAFFLRPNRARRLEEMMLGSDGAAIHTSVGITASTIRPPDWMRECPLCAGEWIDNCGVAVWLREHQITGINVCVHHGVKLIATGIPRRERRSRHQFTSAPGNDRAASEKCGAPERAVAELAIQVLESGLQPEPRVLNACFRDRLGQRGYITAGNRIRWEFADDLRDFFAPSYLLEINSQLSRSKPGWLAALLRRPETMQPPVRYLMLMVFLAITPDYIMAWRAPAASPSIPPRPRPILPKWTRAWTAEEDRKLKTYWADQTISVREIARRFSVESLTVKRRAVALGFAFPRMGIRPARVVPRRAAVQDPHVLRNEKRIAWLELLRTSPEDSRTSLRRVEPGLYAWLHRNDRLWLRDNLPPALSVHGSPGRQVDWRARDVELANRARGIVEELENTAFPHRITTAEVGRRLGCCAVIQKKAKLLPRTAKWLKHKTETRIQFVLRRIRQSVGGVKVRSELRQLPEIIRAVSRQRLLGVRPRRR